ncbi:MAG: hypothetical protein ACLR23_05610 [Clostridia bacterium]
MLDEGTSDGVPQGVTWTVSGNTSANTTISTSGLLTVGSDETIGGTLTIEGNFRYQQRGGWNEDSDSGTVC